MKIPKISSKNFNLRCKGEKNINILPVKITNPFSIGSILLYIGNTNKRRFAYFTSGRDFKSSLPLQQSSLSYVSLSQIFEAKVHIYRTLWPACIMRFVISIFFPPRELVKSIKKLHKIRTQNCKFQKTACYAHKM